MAILGNPYIDLIDTLKMQNDDHSTAMVIEMLMQNNAILEDAIAMECNSGTTHLTSVRTGLPQATWGRFYKGISQGKGETAQVRDTTGFCEHISGVDERLLRISPNPNAIRLSEASAALEAVSQEVAETIIYGNDNLDPEEFTGFAPRFNDLNAGNGGQIVDGGGTGSDNTSIWFVTWGDNQSHLLYPKGTKAGIEREDMGRQRVTDEDGQPYWVKEEVFRQYVGLTVRDWRYTSRIANIDVSQLAAGSVDIMKLLRDGYWKIKKHRLPGTKQAIYANSDVLQAIDAASNPTSSTDSANNTPIRIRPGEADGKDVMEYRKIPLRQVDAILNTEARVT